MVHEKKTCIFFILVLIGLIFVTGCTHSNNTAVQSSSSSLSNFNEQKAQNFKEAIDYTNPVTRDFAVSLIPKSHSGKYSVSQICDVWEALYKKWTYVSDPNGKDYRSPASRTIQLGLKGDCDDFAIVMASVVESIGGTTRIISAHNGNKGHAYAEVYIGNSKEKLNSVVSYISKRYGASSVAYHTTTKNNVTRYWLNLDWQSKYPGGKFFEDDGEVTIFYPDGSWNIAKT